MKKILAMVTLICLLCTTLSACRTGSSATLASASGSASASSSGAGGSDKSPIKIGLTVPLTGDRATEGHYATNAAKIAQEEINAAGGVLGRNIEVVVEDSMGTDVGATTAYLKLASDKDIVAIIGSDNSNDNIAIAGSVESAQILTTTQGSSPKLKAACESSQWMFQLRACDSTLCAALMDYAYNGLSKKTFTVIHDTETASADQANLFEDAIKKLGGTVDKDISFVTGTKDFTAQLTQAKQAGSDAIVIACLQTEGSIILKQLRDMGIEQPIFGSNAFGDTVTVGLAGKAIEGVYSVTAWVPNTPNPTGAPFSAKYSKTYNEDCAKGAAQARDHINVICKAISLAGSTDRTAVRDAMLKITDYQGAITTYDCSKRGDCGRGGLIVQIKDLKPTIVKEITTN